MPKRIAVIGAGPGGLASAMLLASKGFEVDVYEKKPYAGGRNGFIKKDGFTFDIGPTFLSMPEIAEELFEEAGRNIKEYMDMKELTTMYELVFPDKDLTMYKNPAEMKKELARVFPGSEEGYERFMKDTRKKMARLKPLLQNPMDKLYHYAAPNVLRALPQLSLGKSLYNVLSRYFKEEELRLGFTFQSKYLGMSPWECPGAFSILSFMEHEYGIFHPIGGVNQLSQSMAAIVREYGGRIHLGTGVDSFIIKDRRITGLRLEDGGEAEVDEVVVNGDFAHVMSQVMPDGMLKKYSKEKLKKRSYSCSAFMIYLGISGQFDLPHHTIIFADDYKKNVEEITRTMKLPDDPSIYIQNAGVTDPTLAPEGKSTLYILAPVPNNMSGIDWRTHEKAFRDLVIETVEKKSGFKGLQERIETEIVVTPHHWQQNYYVYEGAVFNLSHHLRQMMVFRPHNKFEELENCWLAGGGTHPGSGLPTILESARITTHLIEKKAARAVRRAKAGEAN
ncbi:phytoene desaturase family protein [Domibacillus indicus]|uniref:phytoene desaturase family protein n=1 Tax=Domibacillus indicus TaxID=1437523 RepID=UPI00061810E3|nr:phytoene desaturase family protein [Domibacillus indicus]